MPAESGDSRPGSSPHPTRTVLILGGARSGKSTFAEHLAPQLGEPILFLATAEALDDEMAGRIAAHRASRPTSWATIEAPTDLGQAILQVDIKIGTILLDCVTMLVSNVLLDDGRAEGRESTSAVAIEGKVQRELDELIGAAADRAANLVMVSNEVGLGLVPDYPLGRIYRDVLGRANQRLASVADDVYLLVAGIPLVVKGRSWPTDVPKPGR